MKRTQSEHDDEHGVGVVANIALCQAEDGRPPRKRKHAQAKRDGQDEAVDDHDGINDLAAQGRDQDADAADAEEVEGGVDDRRAAPGNRRLPQAELS